MPPDGEKDGGKEAGRERGGGGQKQQKTGGGEIKMYKRCSKGRTIGGKEREEKERRCTGTAMLPPHK